ncbi:response regulator [Alishewanella longhuensis]
MQLSATDLHILLVEPSDVQRKIIKKRLSEENVNQVIEAATLQQALELIKQQKPDAIACALHFADGTGEQLLQQLKANIDTADIPFMLVSSESRKAHLEAFKQSGVVAILPKPFDAMNLVKH